MRQKLCLIALFTMLTVFAMQAGADTLFLHNGNQYEGHLQQMTPKAVVFQTSSGTKTYDKADVLRVQLQRAREYDNVNSVDEITDPVLKGALAAQSQADAYTSAAYVTLFERHTYDLSTPGVVKETVRRITKILRQRGEDVASNNVYYFDDTDTPEIDFALTVTPGGRVLHLSDSALKNESLFSSLPAYKRLSRFRFACKEPRPGSVLDVQYTVRRTLTPITQPLYDEITFRADEPILAKEVMIIVPETRADSVRTQLLNAADVIQTSKAVEDGNLHLTFALTTPQAGIISEPFMPPLESFAPTLVLGDAVTWDEVDKGYADKLNALPPLSEQGGAKARELAKEGGATAIQNFVTRTITTVPVPQTAFRMVPHAPDETLGRGVANELDKNFLLYAMLKAAGIDADFGLVRTRTNGPLPKDVPSIMAFNRSAVYFNSDARYATTASDTLDLTAFPGPMQHAPALMVLGGASADGITMTSEAKPEDELSTTQFDGGLDGDGNLELTVTYRGIGNAGTWLRELKDYDDQQLRKVFEQLAANIHPAAVLEHYTTTDLADLTIPAQAQITVSIPGYAFKAGEKLMLVTLPTVDYSASSVGRPTREHDLFWSSTSQSVTEGKLRVPKGYKVYYLPKDVNVKTDTASYRSHMKVRWHVLHFKDAFTQEALEAPATAYEAYKHCVEARADLARQRIVLEHR